MSDQQPAPKSPLVNIAVSIMAAIDCCRSRDTISNTTNTVSNSGTIIAPGNTISEIAPDDAASQDVPVIPLQEP